MSDADRLAVTITLEELSQLVERAVARAIENLGTQREVLTLELAAELLDLHPKVLSRYIREHKLPAHKIGPEYRFRRSELLKWLDGQDVP